MRLLVCGGRAYSNRAAVFAALDRAHAKRPVSVVIHGGARGADSLAEDWAVCRHVEVMAFPADWRLGKAAGPLRNEIMLKDGKPDAVIAFPGGRGTEHMVSLAREAGLPVWQPEGV